MPVAKPEWGVKRICQSCAVKFYDLKRSPINCPKCGARFNPEALLKSRRSRPPTPAKTAKPEPAAASGQTPGGTETKAESNENEAKDDTASKDGENDDTVLVDTPEGGGDDIAKVASTDVKKDD
jgi:uncharacterized protein (TIGR02300 family)